MEYTKEQIYHAKKNAGSLETLEYIAELETRLKLVNGAINEFLRSTGFPELADINNDAVLLQKPTEQGEELPTMDNGQNGLGDTITLYLFNGDGDPRVSWAGCCGYDAVDFHTETKEEAHALFKALLTIKNVDAD